MRPEDRYDSLFQFYAEKSGGDWLLLKAQVKVESDFFPYAKSPAGARGLAQFMHSTFSEWAAKLGLKSPDIYNPEHSIQCQAAYMAWLIGQFANSPPVILSGAKDLDSSPSAQNDNRPSPPVIQAALAAYNWGIGKVKTAAAAMGEAWKAALPEETQNYLARVETNYKRYRKEQEGVRREA